MAVTAPEAPAPTPGPTERGRLFRYGGNTVAMVLLAAAVIVIANLLAGRLKVRWDLTEQGTHTLAEQTKNVLTSLNAPVKVTGFYSQFSAASKQRAEDLLREYEVHTDRLQVEFIDPDQQPGRAREMAIQQDGVLVIQSGDRRQDVLSPTESQITGALLKISVSGAQPTVYFVSGHGERSFDDSSGTGYSIVKSALERDNFKVESLNLATATTDNWKQGVLVINSGARVSNVGGQVRVLPTTPLLPQEAEKLQAFIKEGGRALFLLAPESDASYGGLLSAYGMKVPQGVVLDPVSSLGDLSTPAVQRPAISTITEGLPLTIFPQSTAILDEGERPQTLTVQPLMETSPESWLETDLRAAPRFDEGADTKGPLRLALTAEGLGSGDNRGRAVIVGSADAFANGVLQSFIGIGNQDLFLNSVNWLAQQEAAIGIRPRDTQETSVLLSPGQQVLILVSAVALFPVLILFWGIGTWWSRR